MGKLFDKYPNLYADIGARYGELAPILQTVKAFMEKYSNRIVYGTDMGASKEMYCTIFRILESADEHFYAQDRIGYRRPLHVPFLAISYCQYRNLCTILALLSA